MLNQVQKFGRTVFRRASEIALFTACLVLTSNYVGGLGLSVIFALSVLFWLIFNAFSVLPTHTRYLGALIIAVADLVFVTTTVVPVLRSFSWFHSKMMTAYPIQERDYISYSRDAIEVIHPWVIPSLMAVFAFCALPLIMVSHRSIDLEYPRQSFSSKCKFRFESALDNTGPRVSRYVALVPLGAIAILQYANPIRAITFTMSGDARNVFLYVMRSRLNWSLPTFTDLLQGGKLGETLATSITVSNGTQGFPRLADQYAVRSVYFLMMCIIVCGLASFVTAHSKDVRGARVIIRDCTVLVMVAFAMVSPYPLGEILRSGFVSLFVGIGFLVAALAFLTPEKIARRDVAALAVVCIVATLMSYQLIALLVIPIASASLLRFVWKLTSQKATKVVIIGFLALFSLGAASRMSSIAVQFSRRVNDGGAIRTTSIAGVVVVFLLALAFSGVVHGRARHLFISTSAVTGSALVTLQLIARARSDTTDTYGYYGQKLMYAANYISWFLLIAMLGIFLSYLNKRPQSVLNSDPNGTKYFWYKTLGTVSFVALITLSVVFLSTAKSPVISIYRGWDSPSEEIVTRTFDNWKSGSEKYVFAFYATDSNDRMGNFWSPFFWEINRWEWTYSGYNVDAKSLCSVINGNEITLITSSQDLLRQMRGMCSPTLDKVTVKN
jgi:hypothetical protein